jgi:hypothetical protein
MPYASAKGCADKLSSLAMIKRTLLGWFDRGRRLASAKLPQVMLNNIFLEQQGLVASMGKRSEAVS